MNKTFYSAYLKKLFIKLNLYYIDNNFDKSTTFSVWSIKFVSQVIILLTSGYAYIKPCFRRSPKLADKFNKYGARKLDNWIGGDLPQKGTFLGIKTPKNRRT